MYSVLHHGNELLVAQQSIPVVVKYLEDGIDHVAAQVLPCTDVHCSGKLVLCYISVVELTSVLSKTY